MTMNGFDRLFDPAGVAPRWARVEPPAPAATRSAGDALADLSAAVGALAVPPRARAALAILLEQIATRVAEIQAAPPPPPDELTARRAELAALLDRVEDHLEALVLYAPRSP